MEHADILRTLDDLCTLRAAFSSTLDARERMRKDEKTAFEMVELSKQVNLMDPFTEPDIIWALTTTETSIAQKLAAISIAGINFDGLSDALCKTLIAIMRDEIDPQLAHAARECLESDTLLKQCRQAGTAASKLFAAVPPRHTMN